MDNEKLAQEADVRAQEAETEGGGETAQEEKESRVGARDGVSMRVNCFMAEFAEDAEGKKIVSESGLHEAIILASYENGTVSISDRVSGVMLSVRIDEMMALMAAAADAAAGRINGKTPPSDESKELEGKGPDAMAQEDAE